MYFLFKLFSRVSKFLSNALIVIALPVSLILIVGLSLIVFLQNFLDGIGLWSIVNEQLTKTNSHQALQYCQLVALIILLIIVVCWIIFIVSWCLKKTYFKKIGDMYISRNKEYRNSDINEYKEKLEKYRYRD